jgi:lysine 6-dehydrogenase
MLTFNLAGLTNEYAEPGVFLRGGELVQIAPLEELEMVDLPAPIGRVEAFTTGGGVSTMPWTFAGKLRTLLNKTIRYPGHFAQIRAFYDLGLWGTDPVRIGAQEVVPREVFHQLFTPLVTFPEDPDVCAILIHATGRKNGRPARAVVEVMDFYDAKTGFTAMERTTGWDAAIVAGMMARGQTPCGAVPLELAVPPDLFVAELAKRGIEAKAWVETRPE